MLTSPKGRISLSQATVVDGDTQSNALSLRRQFCHITLKPCNMQKFLDFLRERHPDAVEAQPVDGKNGRFISVKLTDGSYVTYPMGKRSYELEEETDLNELNVVIADDGQAIATRNVYKNAGAAVKL